MDKSIDMLFIVLSCVTNIGCKKMEQQQMEKYQSLQPSK